MKDEGKCEAFSDGIPVWKKYALSIPEAAKYFGIGEKRLYQVIEQHKGANCMVEVGSHGKIHRECFVRFLEQASCV
ncbi:MAG: transposase [Lachnospiraceae bacterium]|nr:transposase [Lachnospiraceae bacterium]